MWGGVGGCGGAPGCQVMAESPAEWIGGMMHGSGEDGAGGGGGFQ